MPDREHPNFKFGSVSAPWTPAAAAYLAEQVDLVKAGKPNNIYINCLPEGMPSLVIMARSASEFLFTPGRLTILGENDSQRVRSSRFLFVLATALHRHRTYVNRLLGLSNLQRNDESGAHGRVRPLGHAAD